jgi:hypothetical protein
MKIRYQWRRLTDEGLLVEPSDVFVNYCEESVNGWDGFDTKEEAVDRVDYLRSVAKWAVPSKLVLIEQYEFGSE